MTVLVHAHDRIQARIPPEGDVSSTPQDDVRGFQDLEIEGLDEPAETRSDQPPNLDDPLAELTETLQMKVHELENKVDDTTSKDRFLMLEKYELEDHLEAATTKTLVQVTELGDLQA